MDFFMKCARVAFSVVPGIGVRIEIEFEFDILLCFGISLAPYAVFSTRIYLQDITRPIESKHPINTVFVRPSTLP